MKELRRLNKMQPLNLITPIYDLEIIKCGEYVFGNFEYIY